MKQPKLLDVPILFTKLYAPPARTNAIARPHLIEKLLNGAHRSGTFSLLSGPAGFGKTTLLSEFVTQLRQPVAWVSLDEGDNEPSRFWWYLIAACQSVEPGLAETAEALIHTSQSLPDDTVPTILINDLASLRRNLVLILDDYHHIQNPSIHAGCQFLIEHLPEKLQVVVSTRVDPPWPLARYRARNQLVEIRAHDLRFSIEEAGEFLNRTMELDLSIEDVAALEKRTEGWIAGLQLAALSMQGRGDTTAFIQAFTGSHIYIAEYLIEEILQHQPEDLQLFLLQTSLLENLNAELCEAVTGCQDGQAILTALHRTNSFIVPLDHEGRWFRYHHLFADLLNARLRQSLSAETIATLHNRASNWYEQNGFHAEAVHHALAAGNSEQAAILVDQAGQIMMFTSQFNLLKKWLDALPEEAFRAHPRLEVYLVLIELSQGTLDMSEQTLLEKERMIRALPPSPENDRLRLEAMVYLCLFLAHQDTARTIQIAQEILDELPDHEMQLRISLFSALYRAYGMEGNIDKSESAYVECFRLAQAADQYGIVANTTMVRTFDLCQYGRLEEAARYCQLIIERGNQQQVFYPAGPCHIGLAGIYLEWNDLEKADDYLTRGIEICRQGGLDGLYTGYTVKARLHQARGDLEAALAVLHSLEQSLQRRDFFLMTRQVSVQLAVGDVASLSAWVPSLTAVLDVGPDSHMPAIAVEALKLILARILIAQGELERADQRLGEIQATAEADNRFGRLM
ncbi:MAG: hypothetical protein K8L99_21560, partial [Anaerolineae bacterium]|nr:hypothetical protein [Anaerolineae bacterium]